MRKIYDILAWAVVASAIWVIATLIVSAGESLAFNLVAGIAALIEVPAMVMVVRRQRPGLFILLLCALAQVGMSLHSYHWYYAAEGNIAAIGLFLLAHLSPYGRKQYALMCKGIIFKQFRHIFQLMALLLCAFVVFAVVRDRKLSDPDETVRKEIASLDIRSVEDVDFYLNRAELTLEQLNIVEAALLTDFPDDYDIRKDRISAMRHILTCIMQEVHSASTLMDAYSFRSGDLSESQRSVLAWFSRQDASVHRRWEASSGVKSLSEFKKILDKYED